MQQRESVFAGLMSEGYRKSMQLVDQPLSGLSAVAPVRVLVTVECGVGATCSGGPYIAVDWLGCVSGG